jgi:hypothetical protein
MRTQVFANQYIDCTVVLFAHTSVSSPTLRLGFLQSGPGQIRDRPTPSPPSQFACDLVVADGFSEHIKNGLTLILFSFIRDDPRPSASSAFYEPVH